MYYTTDYISPVGVIKLAADGERLVGLWLRDRNILPVLLKKKMRRRPRNLGFLKIQRTGWTAILQERGLSPQSFCWLPWEENSGRVVGNPLSDPLWTAHYVRRYCKEKWR